MTNKIFHSTILMAVAVLLCSLGIVLSTLYGYFSEQQIAQLEDELSLAVTGAEQYGTAFLENVEADRFRITWVGPDGTVLFDTRVDAAEMENHLDREEITEALETGYGSSSRYSSTLMEKTIYEAKMLSDGTVLRISGTQISVGGLILEMFQPISIVVFLAVGLALLLAHRMARKIVEPLNTLDLDHPLENDTYEELSPLLRRINQQHQQIDSQMRKLQRKTDEFEQITANMQEGLIVLDKETHIRSINSAAQQIFQTDETCVGGSFFMVNRSSTLRQALNDALDRGHGSTMLEQDGREYRLDMSSIRSGGKLLGAVILAFDVTEQRNAERNRREFSANVSHELKTPLQSIIGSAELLESGLVKPEDTAHFVGRIRKEAARMVRLIEDILRLSHLDEGMDIPREDVDLMRVAQEATAALQIPARDKNVRIHLSGEHCVVRGIPGLVYEIVHNLCSNAVKYNTEGGQVYVEICKTDGHVVLTVTDTGIGIPPEHQSRVFERFYRVDKSHSRQIGGTGLGLSIVKHAAQYHNAVIHMQSTPGTGTTITVTF